MFGLKGPWEPVIPKDRMRPRGQDSQCGRATWSRLTVWNQLAVHSSRVHSSEVFRKALVITPEFL